VIGQIDQAITQVNGARAALGAVISRLQNAANNNNIASVNLTASESSIRDLNVGQATSEYNKDQILVQIGTTVLAQSNTNAQTVLGLFR
jgi:flagellin